jgi:hypothetical protein
VPAFQRGFEWKQQQIIELLESVYRGFPIGSLLLWKVDRQILKLEAPHEVAFPVVQERYPLCYILDGMQRLSTLYGVCNYAGDAHAESLFNVLFDLRGQIFCHYEENQINPTLLPMSALFSPKELLQVQRWLADLPDGNQLIDRSIELHAIFQEYLVPTVTIADRDLEDVVRIFERVNSTGQKLSSVDFMRAVTWSQEFDLTIALRELSSKLSEKRFSFSDETLVKVIGLIFNRDPISAALLSLRNLSAKELIYGVERAHFVLEKVAEFLRTRFAIYSSDYVPYEGQVLILAKVFIETDSLDYRQESAIERWFWATSLNEGLKGKPDNFVARAVKAVPATLSGQRGGLQARLTIDERDIVDRRFIAGKAMSCAIAAMFAVHQSRRLTGGDVIDPSLYMSEFSAAHFEPILNVESVNNYARAPVVSARVMSNLIVLTDVDRDRLHGTSLKEALLQLNVNEPNTVELLHSQFLDFDILESLRHGRFGDFARGRAGLMMSFARTLVG